MAMKLTVKVGTDTLEAEGDFTVTPEVVELAKVWASALPTADEVAVQDQIDELGAQVGRNTDDLSAAAESLPPTGTPLGTAASLRDSNVA